MRPADALADHRRRHRRIILQELTDPILESVCDRPLGRPLILRRTITGQRRYHRVRARLARRAIASFDTPTAIRSRRTSPPILPQGPRPVRPLTRTPACSRERTQQHTTKCCGFGLDLSCHTLFSYHLPSTGLSVALLPGRAVPRNLESFTLDTALADADSRAILTA